MVAAEEGRDHRLRSRAPADSRSTVLSGANRALVLARRCVYVWCTREEGLPQRPACVGCHSRGGTSYSVHVALARAQITKDRWGHAGDWFWRFVRSRERWGLKFKAANKIQSADYFRLSLAFCVSFQCFGDNQDSFIFFESRDLCTDRSRKRSTIHRE